MGGHSHRKTSRTCTHLPLRSSTLVPHGLQLPHLQYSWVEKKLIQECTVAVRPSSGLHASVTAKSADQTLSWDDVGLTTVADVTDVLKKHQPLIWHYLIQLTTPKARKQKGMVIARKYRPPEVVRDPHCCNKPTLTGA